jgi:hypothetical protein
MTAVREQLEALLGARNLGGTLLPPWALTPGVRVLSTGVPSLDARFGGGWRQGELSELVARRSAGRTSVLAASLAVATADGGVAALVDALDRLDPPSLEAAGADLSRVLWVRGPAVTVEMARPALTEDIVHRAVRAFDLILRAGGFTLAAACGSCAALGNMAAPRARQRGAGHGGPARWRRPDGPQRPRRVDRAVDTDALDGHERSKPEIWRI